MRISMELCSRRMTRMAVMPLQPSHVNTRRRQHITTTRTITTTLRGGGGGGGGIGIGGYEDEGVVVILGATGTGKSKLSIDIGTRYPSEIINSDKIQVYRGLDITTNKMPLSDRYGVPHHILGELDPADGELTPAGFRSLASRRIAAIRSRRRLPVVAGGSNSFVHALLALRHDPLQDPFEQGSTTVAEKATPLSYRSCLLWVDVEWETLAEHLDRRVDEMVKMGMVEELADHFDPRRAEEGRYSGLDMAIGVPEFDRFFLRYSPRSIRSGGVEERRWWRAGEREDYEAAVGEIKANTRALAARQRGKIETMWRGMGWAVRRLDATEAVRRKAEGRGKAEVEEAWARDVLRPAEEKVGSFVKGEDAMAAACRGEGRRWWWWGRREAVVGDLLVAGV